MGLYAENAWFAARTVGGPYTVNSEEYDEHGPLFRAIVERGTAQDATLAAAAPELAETLHDLVSCAETFDEFNDPTHDYYVILKAALHAINRVEGRPCH